MICDRLRKHRLINETLKGLVCYHSSIDCYPESRDGTHDDRDEDDFGFVCESGCGCGFSELFSFVPKAWGVAVAVGIEAKGRRGVWNTGFTLIGGVTVGEGMRVISGEGIICWVVIDPKTSCTGGKSEGFGSLSPNAQKILV